jgi:hypothetical protein
VCNVVGVNDIEEGDGEKDSGKELFWEGLLLLLLLSVISMYMELQIMRYKNIQEIYWFAVMKKDAQTTSPNLCQYMNLCADAVSRVLRCEHTNLANFNNVS